MTIGKIAISLFLSWMLGWGLPELRSPRVEWSASFHSPELTIVQSSLAHGSLADASRADLDPLPDRTGFVTSPAATFPIDPNSDDYVLDLLPQGVRQRVRFDPAAIGLTVMSDAGDTILPCGDGWHTYTCTPGKALSLDADPDHPIREFWAQNDSDRLVRLHIQVRSSFPASPPSNLPDLEP